MMLIVWAVIAIAVLLSALLIYLEHEWGLLLGGATAAVLVISYFSADLLMRSPLIVLMPQGSSHFDIMAIAACVLLVAALVVFAFLAGRNSASKDER